jgi:hypothetical protein
LDDEIPKPPPHQGRKKYACLKKSELFLAGSASIVNGEENGDGSVADATDRDEVPASDGQAYRFWFK